MGGVFGHMSHIYDNPGMTFGQIKDIMTKASAGQLEKRRMGKTCLFLINLVTGLSDGSQRKQSGPRAIKVILKMAA